MDRIQTSASLGICIAFEMGTHTHTPHVCTTLSQLPSNPIHSMQLPQWYTLMQCTRGNFGIGACLFGELHIGTTDSVVAPKPSIEPLSMSPTTTTTRNLSKRLSAGDRSLSPFHPPFDAMMHRMHRATIHLSCGFPANRCGCCCCCRSRPSVVSAQPMALCLDHNVLI